MVMIPLTTSIRSTEAFNNLSVTNQLDIDCESATLIKQQTNIREKWEAELPIHEARLCMINV
jgi:hypothetical protein